MNIENKNWFEITINSFLVYLKKEKWIFIVYFKLSIKSVIFLILHLKYQPLPFLLIFLSIFLFLRENIKNKVSNK